MAKSKSFFGLRRGSTKSLTFSVYEGQQVTKDRVTEVKNPRTLPQMEQRMHMASALAMYSAGKEIFDHSFQGVTYGAKSMNKFLADNVKLIRDNYLAGSANFQENIYGNKAALAGKFKVSEGTLPAFDANAVTYNDGQGALSLTIGIAENLTIGTIKNYLGLGAGDYATIFALIHGTGQIQLGGKVQANDANVVICRMYIPENADETVVNAENFATLFTIEKKNVTNVTLTSSGSGASTQWVLKVSLPGSAAVCDAYTAIKSAKQNGVWTRSTQFFAIGSMSNKVTPQQAIETYPIGPSYVLNGGDIE